VLKEQYQRQWVRVAFRMTGVRATALKRNWRAALANRWRSLLAVFAIATVLGFAAWLNREWVLRSAANFWIISDALGPSDVVAVLGGGLTDRPQAAAQYYGRGLIKKILVDDAASESVLLELGIPADAIETFGDDLRNTHQEVFALRVWAERHKLYSVILPTETFSTRRLRWMLNRAFPSQFEVSVIALDPPGYRRDDWWRHRQGIAAFKNEVIKYLYYILRY
jgi:uncharacterized SAM-binding protein YcdF (DUF218 family)